MAEVLVKSPPEHQQAVNRVLASEVFQKSPKLRDLLAFVSAHSLKGERDLLSEQQIGIAVFGRAPGYSPGEDSIGAFRYGICGSGWWSISKQRARPTPSS